MASPVRTPGIHGENGPETWENRPERNFFPPESLN